MPIDLERDLGPVVHVGTLDITIAVNAAFLKANRECGLELAQSAKLKPE